VKMCLVKAFACKSYNETHRIQAYQAAVYQLEWDRKARKYDRVSVVAAA